MHKYSGFPHDPTGAPLLFAESCMYQLLLLLPALATISKVARGKPPSFSAPPGPDGKPLRRPKCGAPTPEKQAARLPGNRARRRLAPSARRDAGRGEFAPSGCWWTDCPSTAVGACSLVPVGFDTGGGNWNPQPHFWGAAAALDSKLDSNFGRGGRADSARRRRPCWAPPAVVHHVGACFRRQHDVHHFITRNRHQLLCQCR